MLKIFFLIAFALSMLFVPGLVLAPSINTDTQSLLSAFVSYTDLRMKSVRQSLEILASTSEAKSANWEKMEPLLGGYQKSDGGLIVWFARPDGTYYTADQGRMEMKPSDSGYFPTLMSGQEIMGALAISQGTGQRFAVIAIPVKERGKVIGAIGASLFIDRFAEQVDSAFLLRPDMSFFALAPDGLTTLYRKTGHRSLESRELGGEMLKKAATEMLANSEGETSVELDNATKKTLYQTSSLTQWKFALSSQ